MLFVPFCGCGGILYGGLIGFDKCMLLVVDSISGVFVVFVISTLPFVAVKTKKKKFNTNFLDFSFQFALKNALIFHSFAWKSK